MGQGPRYGRVSALACPCGSAAPYQACCGPLLRGDAAAATAEALMRSRYTAYVRRDEAYLLRTWDAAHRPMSLELDDTIWLGLQVVSTAAGLANDTAGVVSFAATYENADGSVATMRETSRFERVDGDWVYVDWEPPQ